MKYTAYWSYRVRSYGMHGMATEDSCPIEIHCDARDEEDAERITKAEAHAAFSEEMSSERDIVHGSLVFDFARTPEEEAAIEKEGRDLAFWVVKLLLAFAAGMGLLYLVLRHWHGR